MIDSLGRISAATREFFGEDTPLRHAPEAGGRPYEPRPQQREMALAVAASLEDGHHLCVEAPTGVGKTFAYLLPAIHFARERDLSVVVSTHTISLQEQVVDRDLPVLSHLLDLDLRWAVAKGRANYLCLRRLHAATDPTQQALPDAGLISEVDRLATWAEATEDGSRGDLPQAPEAWAWEQVCCERGNCLGPGCPYVDRCFLMKARRRMQSAHIVVSNHALFFSDLAMRMASPDGEVGILPEWGAVILDEGHTLEDAAANHLGLRVSTFELRRILRRLYNAERGRGLLSDVRFTGARMAAIAAREKAGLFFRRLCEWLEPQPNPLRYTSAGHVPDFLGPYLDALHRELGAVADTEDDSGRRQELRALADRLQALRLACQRFVDMELEEHVYWFERQGRTGTDVCLSAVPIDLSGLLRETVFSGNAPVVVTSATLAVRNRMDYFIGRIGAEDAETLVLDSPFDYSRQVTLHIGSSVPNPRATDRFTAGCCDHIRHFVTQSDGRAFVLFTSYAMMGDVAGELADYFEATGFRLLVQGEGMSRSHMLEVFREDVHSVIFGTSSFWMGVDVPGEALSNVIIVKLPFAVPDHPLVAARQEQIERQGGRAFTHYALPEAILRFRQGFGRLIRSREDHGMVVVLDSRIVKSSYGRAFLESIPPCEMELF